MCDSTYMISLIEDHPFIQERQILVTLDIGSLYTCIPQIDSIRVVEAVLNTRTNPVQVPTWFIVDLLTLALTEIYFKYSNRFYKQCSGTSMGAIFAPTLPICVWIILSILLYSQISTHTDLRSSRGSDI